MISVILYGRNDAHGYNLHRRAALSLNCIAEVLTDPDDEIVFVDYNTPDELPTFVEAIADTLTERCLGLLRVLRVPAVVHQQRFADRTHLSVNEPVARNVAVRRANPANRWLLSTNTDMVFVPLQDGSLSEICADRPDGFYALPRFELPEWLWERLPRSDPHRAIADISHFGPALRLDEPTLSHEWIRFDAPGDFQLILREDFAAVDGFDERMLHGYHVDSNLSRRLLLHRGSIESLEPHVGGYHCNHNRTPTVYHGSRVTNDLEKFFYSVAEPDLVAQRSTWGLPDAEVEEVPVRERLGARYAAVLADTIPGGPRTLSDALRAPFALGYDSGHVLPFIADTLAVSPTHLTIGYIGVNAVLEGMLAAVVDGLGFERSLAVARFDDRAAIDELARVADVFVVDLGVDVMQSEASLGGADPSELPRLPAVFDHAFAALDRLVELERARVEQVKHPRRIVLVNSSAAFWEPYVLAELDCSYTTIHSRVRRAMVKPRRDENLSAAVARARRLVRWYARRESDGAPLAARSGHRVDLPGLDDYCGFGSGWALPEDTGIWTRGKRSQLRLAINEAGDGDYVLTLFIGMICVGSDDGPLRVELLANGERIAVRDFTASTALPWRIDLPSRTWVHGRTELTLVVPEPRSPFSLGWSADDRELGIFLGALKLEEADRSVRLGEVIPFAEGTRGERLLGDGWSTPEPTGVWTDGERACLVLDLTETVGSDLDVILNVLPFVSPEHPELEVEVSAYEQGLGTHVFRYGEDADNVLHVQLSCALLDNGPRAVLDLRLHEPARPIDLGMSADPRRLGLHLRSLTVCRPGAAVTQGTGLHNLQRLRRQLRRVRRT